MDRNSWTGEKAPLVEQQVYRTEMSDCIQNFVNNLPEAYRTVLVLSAFEGQVRYNTINFKLIALIVGAFLLTIFSVVILANYQLTQIVDQSQVEVYAGKLDTISDALTKRYELLQQTFQVEAYEEDFKTLVLNDLRANYYESEQSPMYPFILDGQGLVVLHPELAQGDASLAQQDFVQKDA